MEEAPRPHPPDEVVMDEAAALHHLLDEVVMDAALVQAHLLGGRGMTTAPLQLEAPHPSAPPGALYLLHAVVMTAAGALLHFPLAMMPTGLPSGLLTTAM